MPVDSRDALWAAASKTWFMIAFNEAFTEAVAGRWKVFDDVSKVIIALTASGSAVAGWALWQMPDYRTAWLVAAGAGAVLAILSTALGVAARLKDWDDSRREFSVLQNDVGTFRDRMRITPDFDVVTITKEYVEFRRRYGEVAQRLRHDLLATTRLKNACQDRITALAVQEGWEQPETGG